MPDICISDPNDSRLDPYRHLRTKNLTRYSGKFIAEGRPLVQRLLDSTYGVESVLVDEEHRNDASHWLPKETPTYIIPHAWVDELLGFQFHRGFLACGLRKTHLSPSEACQQIRDSASGLGVFAIGIQDPENLGVILRTAAGLGIETVFLGPGTADPLSRRVLRVSMGAALKLHLVDVTAIDSFLNLLSDWGIATYATSLQEPSTPLEELQRQRFAVVLLGNEAFGLPPDIQSRADQRIKIRMELGVDSFNVSVASGMVLHHLARIAK